MHLWIETNCLIIVVVPLAHANYCARLFDILESCSQIYLGLAMSYKNYKNYATFVWVTEKNY